MLNNFDKDLVNIALAGAIYLIVVACAISSTFTQPLNSASRRFWIIMIIFLPPIGLLAYLPFSLDDPKIVKEWLQNMFPGREDI